jgi:deoxyribodipyrimidine photo-lyase
MNLESNLQVKNESMSPQVNPFCPSERVRVINPWPVDASKSFVLYWMTAFRRTRFNFALQRAVGLAEELQKPLVILESIRCNYRWSSDRFHQFLLDGMIDNGSEIGKSKALYCAFVEPASGSGHGLLEEFANHSCAIVADDFPCFFHPALYQRIASRWSCSVELVDSNTIVPMRATDRTFTVAHSYRRYMQKEFSQGVPVFPVETPLKLLKVPRLAKLPTSITERWPVWTANEAVKQLKSVGLSSLPINHSILPTGEPGGSVEGLKVLNRFVEKRLNLYQEARNEPEQDGSSCLSPYLHFGQISPHEVFSRIATASDWEPRLLGKPNGKMGGFWNMGDNAEAFIDQLLTWREIGFNQCWRDPKYDRFESLPEWAKRTLQEHEKDTRPWLYCLEQFESAATHDSLWNAAQNQLKREGRIHNYLRMLWGKKILHWSESPHEALRIMIELNNKYALDGRDPNSYSGIFWVLGRYDRAWGPERPVFGKIRYMTSESTQSKFHVKQYIATYKPSSSSG